MFTRSRRRLTYLFTMPMGLILFAFTFIVYYRQVQNQLLSFDKTLYSMAEEISKSADYHQTAQGWEIIYNNSNLWQKRDFISICWYNYNRNLVANFSKLETDSCLLKLNNIKGFKTILSQESELKLQAHKLRQLTLPIAKDDEYIAYLQVTLSLKQIENNFSQTRLFLSLGLPVTLGLIGIVGWFLGGLVMQPTELAYKQLQRFTADASHELRAPVAAILSNAQVGLLAPENNTQQPRQRLENIVDISKTMSSLISNLLLLARHEGRLNTENLKKIDLVIFLQNLIQGYESIAKDKELDIIIDLPSTEVNIKADPEIFKQAIKNLLDNACKYTLAGGRIKILLNTRWLKPTPFGLLRSGQIPMRASRQAFIEIQDSGVGIPEKDLPHIFERFYRVDTARTRTSGGFGLGLAISLQIIQAHGGQITVNSTIGKGTTFQICLPLKKSM